MFVEWINREPGSVRRVHLEVAKWLWVGPRDMACLVLLLSVCLLPALHFLTQLCFLFLCQSISGSEGLSRPWALTCCSIAHCCYAGVAAARWTSFL